ncbi:TIGR03943 family putative permease subunit [Anaerocolumna xylanovorans]|uniref:Putative membrane protein n=1 Tax=Anaerocolumna xylanovorans DSM 12503 TaxID=1121345 RepID=A0A1M7YJB9_9FIRM|nr:TIGR03943 family protein [Anaerocolumna xylanovorans]SHO52700.1 putative membrane protein [Anaerocolumna xylanovorans DSM 12503]
MAINMRGNKNLEIYMKLFTVIALALFLVYELLSGKVYYYVHPRYKYGIWFAAIALFVFAFSMIGELKKGRHNSGLKRYLIYLLPILLAFLFPDIEGGNGNVAIAQSSRGGNSLYENTVDKTDNDPGAVSDSTQDSGSITGDSTQDSENITSDGTDDTGGAVIEKDRSLKYKNKTSDGAILITDDEFSCWYFELFDYLKDFKGKRYQFTAQVFTSDELKADQFLAGRYIMTCCAVDLMGYGIITDSTLSSKLKENEWITVTGTIGEYNYKGTKVPLLKDAVISKTKAPKEEYVYYYYY